MKQNIITATGKKGISFYGGFRNFFKFLVSIIKSFQSFKYLSFRSIYDIIVNQIKFTGLDAFRFVVFIALVIGATVIIQALTKFPKFGIEGFIGNLLVIIVAREVGPLVTALIVIGRSGSAMTAEIATQKQNRELLSLEIMGIDTKLYIVFPRIIATIISIFSLMVIFDIVAFIGGYIISLTVIYIPMDMFMQTLLDAFTFEDLLATIFKSIIYGILIPVISCYYGFMPRSKFEIPIFVSRSVIRTLSVIFIINGLISVLFYL